MWTRRAVLAAGVATAGCVAAPRSESRDCADGGPDARLGFVGDVMLGRGVTDRWTGNDPAGVWGTTLDRLRALDALVLNLECCLAEGGQRWPDKTYYFRAAPSFAVPALAAADASVAALANNHILDFRRPGLVATLDNLDTAGVAGVGAGRDRESAFAPAVVDANGLTVATLSLSGRWSAYAATPERAGTAYVPLDPATPTARSRVRDAIDRAMAADPDLVVASLHWGPNWETTPDAAQSSFARWLVDHGVDVVHGHSAHVLQGVEVYRGRPIIYDAGDFVDDYVDRADRYNKRSALFELTVTDGNLEKLHIVPTRIANKTAHLADGAAAAWVRETVRERSESFDTTVERAGDSVVIPLDPCS